MRFILYKQKPVAKKNGLPGRLSANDKIVWMFDDDDFVSAELHSPEIIFVNQDGLMLRGFEPAGFTASGQQKFNYQEWLLKWAS